MLPPLCTLPVSSTSAPPFTRSPVVPGYPVRGSPSADASGDFARGDFDFDRRRVIARSSSVPSPSVPPPRPSTPCVASSPSSSAPGNSSSRGVKKSDSLSNAVDASLSAVDGNNRSRAIGFHASGHPSDIGDTRHASMTLGMAVPAAVARACPSPRSVPGIPASPGGGRAIIEHEMSGTETSCVMPPREWAPARPDRWSRNPAPEKDPLRLSDLLLRRLRCRPRCGPDEGCGECPRVSFAATKDGDPLRPFPWPLRSIPGGLLASISVAASSSSSPTTDPPSPDIVAVPPAGSPCESIVTSGFPSLAPLPLTSSERDVSRDELPSPVTRWRSSSRSPPRADRGLHGSSESRSRPSHTPPCASSSACAARVPWSLEPDPPPSRSKMPPAILPRVSPAVLSPFDSPRVVAPPGAVSPPVSSVPARHSAPPSALGPPDLPLLDVRGVRTPRASRAALNA